MKKCLSVLLCGLCGALLLTAGGCGEEPQTTAGVDTKHPLYERFTEAYPDKAALLSISGDCNDDGIEDFIVVYSESASENAMITIFSTGDDFAVSGPIPAPLENCVLQWKDIDEQPPVELLVSGQKGAHLGYAIFRFEDGAWMSLFGDGMDGCC